MEGCLGTFCGLPGSVLLSQVLWFCACFPHAMQAGAAIVDRRLPLATANAGEGHAAAAPSRRRRRPDQQQEQEAQQPQKRTRRAAATSTVDDMPAGGTGGAQQPCPLRASTQPVAGRTGELVVAVPGDGGPNGGPSVGAAAEQLDVATLAAQVARAQAASTTAGQLATGSPLLLGVPASLLQGGSLAPRGGAPQAMTSPVAGAAPQGGSGGAAAAGAAPGAAAARLGASGQQQGQHIAGAAATAAVLAGTNRAAWRGASQHQGLRTAPAAGNPPGGVRVVHVPLMREPIQGLGGVVCVEDPAGRLMRCVG